MARYNYDRAKDIWRTAHEYLKGNGHHGLNFIVDIDRLSDVYMFAIGTPGNPTIAKRRIPAIVVNREDYESVVLPFTLKQMIDEIEYSKQCVAESLFSLEEIEASENLIKELSK